ncbi:unnamed protein product [Rotaria magnacalcarata]|uniref:BZIP domain-containing protein n=1 Tax=Rotaria magnacalcarata TaxID=392030 RepID=A0A817AED1_9BILA|nr:unnamed protein product [Rotaria magnacalcarata]CAF1553214.1 unnamed protein product [Rotaria magnacalcarata]CAF2107122.1 unnamed protein product [Rotaria magnacalcarata]CAF2256790.1 unnamed protein product [Rotaria magnacalcarata]CAF4040430.1 unnamed protein product [Rotaria magnacalcarata]
MQKEHSLPSSDESSNDTISSTPNAIANDLLNHNPQIKNYQHVPKSGLSMKTNPSCVKGCQLENSNKMIERKPKPVKLISKKLAKRELRSKRKCETRREDKTESHYVKQLLEKQVRELEFKQNNLLKKVQMLQLYKEQLELKCEQEYPSYKLMR